MLKRFSENCIKKIKKSKNIVFGNEADKSTIEKITLKDGDTYSSENIKILQDFLVGISAGQRN
jgi:vacuolar-type H+-ATPase subunit E/Vma4